MRRSRPGTRLGPPRRHRRPSETELATPLQKIIDGDFAVNMHQSVDNLDTYIACGDIG